MRPRGAPDFKRLTHHEVAISVGAFALPKGPGGEPRLMVERNIKKENGKWTASADPVILKDGRLVMEKQGSRVSFNRRYALMPRHEILESSTPFRIFAKNSPPL